VRSDADTLARLSQAVLALHRGSRDWPAAAFDSRACEVMAGVLAFDACLWGSARADDPVGTPLSLHGLHAQGLAPEVLAQCLAGQHPAGGLLASHLEPLASRRVELRLWRDAANPAFGAADAQALQFLMPHLVEAQRENRLARASEPAGTPRHRRSLALCDEQGVLQQVDEHGLALLRLEWPRWLAARLPDPLLATLGDGLAAAAASGAAAMAPHYGRGVTVLLTRMAGGAVLLEIRRRADADRLSSRQRDIATLYAGGHTGPAIAQQLGLSPSTVNNHLGVIFKKLAVKNKLQLLDAMRNDVDPAALRG
jgi:DNA-binding CsgD family transcriptional regulator